MLSYRAAALCHLLLLQGVNGYINVINLIPHRRRSAIARVGLFSTPITNVYNDDTETDRSSSGNDVSSSSSATLAVSGDWSAYLDESKGLIFYFNPQTGESKWEPPEGTDFSGVQTRISAAKKVEMRERLKMYLEARLDSIEHTEGATTIATDNDETPKRITNTSKKKVPVKEQMTKEENKDIIAEWDQWQALVDNKRGAIYYYSKKTSESTWDKPTGFPNFKLSASKRIALEEQRKRYAEWNKDTTPTTKEVNLVVPEKKDEPEPKVNSLPIVQQGDWSAYFDIQSGLVFYYNESNGVTTWDPPFKDFPRIVMEKTIPKVLESGSGNISMERALGYIGVDEMAEAVAWEEAKKKERERKADRRAKKKEAGKSGEKSGAETMYKSAKKAELERIGNEKKQKQQLASEAAAKLKLQQDLEENRLKKERMVAKKKAEKELQLVIQNKLDEERIEAEGRASKEQDKAVKLEPKPPTFPKEDPTITVESVETMVAPLRKTDTLYDILQCSSTAPRTELKRSYLSLAKKTHPDALLQIGVVNDDEAQRQFVRISEAWEILGDSTSRRRYDRELQAKGISSKAGGMFESWVMGAAKAMDEALAKAEDEIEDEGEMKP